MQHITIRTTQNKFIVSIDKHQIDGEVFARFVEKLKLKILSKENNINETLDQIVNELPFQPARYASAQRFKFSAQSHKITTKYDVYEQ